MLIYIIYGLLYTRGSLYADPKYVFYYWYRSILLLLTIFNFFINSICKMKNSYIVYEYKFLII